jgi:cell division protease FtsH
MHDFEFAKDKVMMGSERRSMIISEAEKKVTAIHEAGHALLAVVLPHADPIHKVTIIPRGMALGVTMQLPEGDKFNYTRDYLNDQIAILLGGRLAEELTNGGMTTGAGNDLERSTELARKMVCEWGMSDFMGPLTFGKKEEQIFLGREIAQHQDYSEDTAIRIDQELKRIVMTNYERSKVLLEQHRVALDKIAEELLAREVLDADQVRRIVAGDALEPIVKAPNAAAPPAADDARKLAKDRPSIVPPIPPRPLTQE